MTPLGSLKENQVFRGGPLHNLSDDIQNIVVNDFGIRNVIDLRTQKEKDATADNISGINLYEVDIMGESSRSANPSDLIKSDPNLSEDIIMEDMYQCIIISPHSQKRYQRFFEILANVNEPVYFHCTAGKDRTGIAVLLLLSLLGVSEDDIMEDYLKTNNLSIARNSRIERHMEKDSNLSPNQLERVKSLLGVYSNYIVRVCTTIDEYYGSIDNYLTQILNITPKLKQIIIDKYINT